MSTDNSIVDEIFPPQPREDVEEASSILESLLNTTLSTDDNLE